MQIIDTVKNMQSLSRRLRSEGHTIGFVPTMGALHEGHLSLVRQSLADNDITVVSIFVNPTQFGPGEDYEKYPRETGADLDKLTALNVEAVFMPPAKEIYREGSSITVNVGPVGKVLCGISRPGHFNGVAMVVAKLFNIVLPDRSYFGQKDFQQTVIIQKLVRDLNFDINIIVCPTVREHDGIAMSSRNSYLSSEERKAAPALYRALKHGQGLIEKGSVTGTEIRKAVDSIMQSESLVQIEYIEIVNTYALDAMEKIQKPAAICLAAKIGSTRLIDNIIVE
jgi:pantoate--beta-alanine ligase